MKSIFVLILHICISSSYGLITCDIAKTCTEWKEMKCSTVPCSELNHQIAGTMVDDPKYRRVHATFMSDDWISFVIKWNPPTSLFLKGFRIQIGDGLETSILNNFCLLFPSDRCFVGTLVLKNVTFEIHCNYTGYSSRVDILMNSLPMSDAHKPLPDHLIIERPFKRGQRLTSHYLEDSGQLDYEQFLFKQEYKKECQRNDEEENQPHHTIGLIVLAVIIVILIPILLLLKIKQGQKRCDLFCPRNEDDKENRITKVEQEILNTENNVHVCVPCNDNLDSHILSEHIVIKESPQSSLLNLSTSLSSDGTQDIEQRMLEINFGSPLNNLNK